ncbi:hypothetical protein [Streptomyces sp. NPDC093568]|uniref:hypothetical protein n=1 Tax=Streptomyces sp. NPDC093568 TaxID=3366041 RepID=UPI00382E4ABF
MDDWFVALDGAHQTRPDTAPCPYCACLLAAHRAGDDSPEAGPGDDGNVFVRWLRLSMVLVAAVSVVLNLSGVWAG